MKLKYRLVVVADSHNIWLGELGVVGNQVRQPQLGGIGILKFVNQDVLELFLQVGPQVSLLLKLANDLNQHVGVVVVAADVQLPTVALIDIGHAQPPGVTLAFIKQAIDPIVFLQPAGFPLA